MKYGVRSGFRHIRVKEADQLAKEFLSLEKKLKRPPTAEDIVKIAEKGHSTFWEVFERAGLWDDVHAAKVARLDFARYVIQAISVRLDVTDGAVEQRAIVPIRFTDDDPEMLAEGGYIATETILKDEAMAHAYLKRLQKEARRTAEAAAAWAWLISNVPAADAYTKAAKNFAEAPLEPVT